MTTPNIEELIDRLRDPQTRGTTGEWFDRAVAADLLQSQAERIKELEAEVEMWKATANAVVDFEKVQLRATLEQLVMVLEGVEALIEHQYTGTREGMNALQNASDDAQVALTAGRAALAQQGEQQPVCYGCGIPAGDVHMSTCKSGKWPSRVSNGDTAAPAPVAQHGEPVAWTHSCNALCTDGLELWIDHCPHCGKPRTAHAEQWPPGLITDIVLTVTALHKEVDIGWSPDARSHLLRLSTSIGMLAVAPAPQAQDVNARLVDALKARFAGLTNEKSRAE